MDPTTQNILRECADRLTETADLIARSSPAASTTTASIAAPAIAASTSTTASSFQPNSAPSAVPTARAKHVHLFGDQPPAGNPHSRPNNGRRPPRTNRANLPYDRGQTRTRTFVCLASSSSSQLPTPAERVTLALNNLGEKKIEFPRNGNGTQVHQCIVEQFPQLDHRGYSILRTTSESGRSRDLMQIPMPSAGFSVDYLKSVLGQAKAYLRPLQGNIPLKDNEKVRNFQHANIIQLKYFLISYLVFAGLTTGIPCNISPWFHISNGPFLSLTPWWHFQDFCSVCQISEVFLSVSNFCSRNFMKSWCSVGRQYHISLSL